MNKKSLNNCPLCNSQDISHHLTTKDYMLTGELFKVWKCNICSFTFTQGTPDPDKIGKYYQSQDYISHSDTKRGLMNRLYHLSRQLMLRLKWRMVRKVAGKGRLLDIGCGTGYFPGFMKMKGYEAIGVEVDPKARAFAEKEFGLKVFSPEEFISGKIANKFEMITLWHVLEHVHDFDLYMERMKESLVPGGTLVIALPNHQAFDARHYKEYWAGFDVPRHLWHFTPPTLEYLAEKHGLKVNKMKRLPLDPFYNAMLSEKYRGNKFFMISGIFYGKLAYLESLFSREKSSSIVYFLTTKAKKGFH